MDMYKRLGMRHSKVYYGFDGATSFTAALLNVDYMLGESECYGGPLYELLEQSGDIYLYGSKYTLPFGYVAPTGYDLAEEFENNGVLTQNRLVRDLGVKADLLTLVSSETVGDDVRLTVKKSGTYYARVKASGTKKIEAIGGPLETQKFNDLKVQSILYLGYLEEGETITLTNGNEEDETPKVTVDFFLLNESALEQALSILSAQHMTDVEYDSTHLCGKLTLTEPGRLILSIPYEKGWTVLINGEEAEPELFGGSLMAFEMEAGEYELSMHYVPAGKYAGIVVSAVSVAIFVVLILLKKKAK